MKHRHFLVPFALALVACSSSKTDDTAGGGVAADAGADVSQPDGSADDASETDGGVTPDAPAADAGNDGAATYTPPAPCTAPDPAADRDACKFTAGALATDSLGACAKPAQIPVEHIVLLMQENRSFDSYLGHLKGHGQDDVDVPADGTTVPVDPSDASKGTVPWQHAPQLCFSDTNHEWDGSHREWNGGKNDGFALVNSGASDDATGARSLWWYDQTDIPFYYSLASTFAISDRYFCAVMGPTWPNRMYFYAASSFGRTSNALPPGGVKTIFDALDAKGITWKIYKSDTPGAAMFIDVLFNPAKKAKTVPMSQFAIDAAAGNLPQVAWIDPIFTDETGGPNNTSEHPAGNPQVGQKWVHDQVAALMASPQWSSSAMFITYDEHGGIWDHVSPPPACAPDTTPPDTQDGSQGFAQYGFRVPFFVVSPFAKKSYVSHTVHSHTSVLRFVETKFELPALTARDANSDALLDMFDFQNPPFMTPPTLADAPVDSQKADMCKTKYVK